MPTDFFVLLYQAASPDATASNRSLVGVHTLNIIYICDVGVGKVPREPWRGKSVLAELLPCLCSHEQAVFHTTVTVSEASKVTTKYITLTRLPNPR